MAFNPEEILRTVGRKISPRARNYDQLQSLLDEMGQRFPETEARTSVSGYYGPIQRSLKDELFWKSVITGQNYGAPQGAALRAQESEAASRTKKMIPIVRKYAELRTEGLNHNDAMDVVSQELAGDPNLAPFQRIFSQHYAGNRMGPGDLNDPVERQDFKKKGAEIARTISGNEPPVPYWGRRRHRRWTTGEDILSGD